MNGVKSMITFQNSNGTISLAREVFTTLVGDVATSCFGVKGMAMRSMTDGLVHLLKRESMGKGVYITYNEDQSISIELHIIVDQGVNIPVLCHSIISEVGYRVSEATGVSIKSVDVFIDSISLD
jgi:uncharacterized alkaline shock family protein YloU